MLGAYYRFQVFNGTGVSVTATVSVRRWKFASDGAIAFESAAGTPINAVSVATGASSSSAGIDNATDKWLGVDVLVTLAPGSAATGSVVVRVQRSTDGGTTWPDNGRGEAVASVYFNSSAAAVKINGSVE